MQKIFLLGACVSLLTACSQSSSSTSSIIAKDVTNIATEAAGEKMSAASRSPDNRADAPINSNKNSNIVISPMLAYSYSIEFLLPKNNVASLMKHHEMECKNAGPQICQIVNSSIQNNDDATSANLALRAEPNWLSKFRDSLAQNAKDNGGKLLSTNTRSEDLTRQITDSEAKLRALTLLRTRLENILSTHQGKMSDLLEAETKLADVQAEIDTINSEILVSKSRVQMSEVSITYGSKPSAVTSGVFAPLNEAFSQFFLIMSNSLSFLIKLFAAIIPFAIFIIPAIFGIRKIFVNRKRQKLEAASTTIVKE